VQHLQAIKVAHGPDAADDVGQHAEDGGTLRVEQSGGDVCERSPAVTLTLVLLLFV